MKKHCGAEGAGQKAVLAVEVSIGVRTFLRGGTIFPNRSMSAFLRLLRGFFFGSAPPSSEDAHDRAARAEGRPDAQIDNSSA
jgi:hypothetical protein